MSRQLIWLGGHCRRPYLLTEMEASLSTNIYCDKLEELSGLQIFPEGFHVPPIAHTCASTYTRGGQPVRDQKPHFFTVLRKEPHHTHGHT